jgi:lipopolysaccharide export LptBFGC system permease protein LptF
MTSLPQAIALTLPISLLVAISLVLRPFGVNWRLIRRTALLSVAVATANCAIVFYAIPNAKQSFRDALVRALPATAHVHYVRGPMEMDHSSLKRQIASLIRTPGGQRSARRLEYSYQLRLAIVAAAFPLGLAGLAVSVCQRGGRRALSILGIVIGCWTLMALAERTFNALIDADGLFPEYLCAWAPNAILLTTASATLVVKRSLIRPLSASGLVEDRGESR